MRRNTIALIWAGGFLLAALLYVVGPDRFLDRCVAVIDASLAWVHATLLALGAQAYDVVHALALALLAVFVLLSVMAARRGLRGGLAVVGLPIVFLLLVWRPFAEGPTPIGRWLAALVISAAGALVMTRRLLAPPPPPPGRWDAPRWPPADRP
ncbi:MAG: hypothetical protein BGO51_04975 [Rhodospirillales bacterium 69-11]|nr:hypothetical protein [Rhodospirillales bacterium]OJW27097.1 MAG: hypothetical protein BGO51_04975 [Rhodospirillales bacterium 69-11]